MRCLATAVATATPPRTAAFACRWGEMKLIKGGIGRKEKTNDEVQGVWGVRGEGTHTAVAAGKGRKKKKEKPGT